MWWSALVSALLASTSPSPSKAAAVASALAGIERGLTSTKYQHRVAVDARKGIYRWDCSIATRELHGDDSRLPGGEGGFGIATIAFRVDAQGAPRAYGWYGEAQDPATYVSTDIVLGRVFN